MVLAVLFFFLVVPFLICGGVATLTVFTFNLALLVMLFVFLFLGH